MVFRKKINHSFRKEKHLIFQKQCSFYLFEVILHCTMLNYFKYLFRKMALKGGNVYCCICEQSYLTFLPSGDDIKAHSRCPGCYSIDRNRQLYTLAKEAIDKSNSKLNILHIAPENSIRKKLSHIKNITYQCIDKFEIGYVYPNAVRQMDITDLKFDNNTIDLILCSHVLEHVPNDTKAIQEIGRVLKPSGIAYIMVPLFEELENTYENSKANTPELRAQFFGQHDHVRKYGLDFRNKLEQPGFKVEIISFADRFSESEKIRLGFLNSESVFKIEKDF